MVKAIAIVFPGVVGGLLLVLKLISEGKRVRANGNGHERVGSRRNDDVKIDREQIEREFELATTVDNVHNMIQSLKQSQDAELVSRDEHRFNMERILDRMNTTLEGVLKNNELNTGMLGVLVQSMDEVKIRSQHLATSAELKSDGSLTRHDIRGVLHELVFTGKIKRVINEPDKPSGT